MNTLRAVTLQEQCDESESNSSKSRSKPTTFPLRDQLAEVNATAIAASAVVEMPDLKWRRRIRLTLSARKAVISWIGVAVDTAFALHHSMAKGSTVSLIHGNMAGERLFAVSVYPGRTTELLKRPSRQQIFEFALANLDLLLKPNHALGTWFNDEKGGVHVLDVVVCISDRTEALTLGLWFNQLSIYSLELLQIIPVPRPSREVEESSVGGAQ
jgi:hypothetical protein